MSLAEVRGVSLREIFDATHDDADYLLYVQSVTQMTVDVRAEQRREVWRSQKTN